MCALFHVASRPFILTPVSFPCGAGSKTVPARSSIDIGHRCALKAYARLRQERPPNRLDSIRGLDARVPATKHYEPVGVPIKGEVVSPRNSSEMMSLDPDGVRPIVEGDVEVMTVLHHPEALGISVLEPDL